MGHAGENHNVTRKDDWNKLIIVARFRSSKVKYILVISIFFVNESIFLYDLHIDYLHRDLDFQSNRVRVLSSVRGLKAKPSFGKLLR